MQSINFTECTAQEYADWFVSEVKANGGVMMFPSGFCHSDILHKLADAYRIIGYREGYKRGKRDGSYAGYKVGYDKGYDDGYSFCQGEAYVNFIETGWE